MSASANKGDRKREIEQSPMKKKTAAAVSPSRREKLDGRDGHGPSCPVGDGGRMDMDTC